jgi:hypothetical protein
VILGGMSACKPRLDFAILVQLNGLLINPIYFHTCYPCLPLIQMSHILDYKWPPSYDSHNTWQNIYPNVFPSLTHYPESSQRTIMSPSPDNITAASGVLHPIYDHRRSHSSDYNRSTVPVWDANSLNVDNFQYPDQEMHSEDTEQQTQRSESSPVLVPPSLHPSVKVEEPDDPDGCFIMELSSMSPSHAFSVSGANQALAPPTEVPLRATQASKEMRKMMGVFRLNPFAMHSGEGRGVMPALWCGGGPLQEEPLIFEFQLDLEDDSGDRQCDHLAIPSPTDLLGPEEDAQLRSFSPSFELHPEDDMGEEHEHEQEDCADPDNQNEWSSDADCCNHSEVDTSSTTHSVHTPSETRSAHTPFNESSSVYQYPIAPSWDIDSYQALGEEHLPPAEQMEGGHKMHRVHTSTYFFIFSSVSYQVKKLTSPFFSFSIASVSSEEPCEPPYFTIKFDALAFPVATSSSPAYAPTGELCLPPSPAPDDAPSPSTTL